MFEYTTNNVNKLSGVIRYVCKGYSLQLLQKRFIMNYLLTANVTYGHCVYASEAMLILLGVSVEELFTTSPFTLMRAKCDVAGYHWWIQHDDGTIIDPTADQYYLNGQFPPYEQGKSQHKTYTKDANWQSKYMKKSHFVADRVIEYVNQQQLM